MKISKKDALAWFEFFAMLPEEEEIQTRQRELIYATLAQIERAVEHRRRALIKAIPNLKTLENRTLYVGDDGRFPAGCRSCLLGTGLCAVRKTNRCNLECKFCYNYGELDAIPPVGEGLFEIGGTNFYEKDIDLLLSIQQKPTGISYVYLEPFMEIEKYYGIVERFHKAGVHQHLYTNGTLCTEENLKGLAEAGLDEIRFNLGAANCADKVIQSMKIAKEYFPQVGIETPMTQEFFDSFQKKKDAILNTGIDFINCAELHLNPNNIDNYFGEPMYIARRGYVSPISSRDLTLRFMRMAQEENWGITIHDCSNDTKFARDLNLRAKEGSWFGASNYACEFERLPLYAFLPTLRDESFTFVEEEELPQGYRPGDIVF